MAGSIPQPSGAAGRHPSHAGGTAGARGSALPGAPDEAEFWRRFDSERTAGLSDWPPARLLAAVEDANPPEAGSEPPRSCRREVVDRRDASGVAAVAALASSGETVLVLCADALRRRELVTRAVRPARFGGGKVAVASSRLSLDRGREAVGRLRAHGAGVALADWPALAAEPSLADDFAHVCVADPAPLADLDALAAAGIGYLHLLWRPEEAELVLRALAEEWPGRESLRLSYRALRRAAGGGGALTGALAHATLSGARHPYPRSPEAAARRLRVLEELGLVRWSGYGADRLLGVVSSGAADLDRSAAFKAYRRRYQEGERYLSAVTQSS